MARQFDSTRVAEAINELLATAALFEQILRRDAVEASRAKSLGEDSLRSWINAVAVALGGRLGGLLGTIAGSIVRRIFG